MSRAQVRTELKTLLTGLATTGSNVFFSRLYEIPASSLPAISIYFGDEELSEDFYSGGVYARELTVIVNAVVSQNSNLDAQLDQIQSEVEAAIDGDKTLNGAALDCWWSETGEPELNGEAETPTATQQINFMVIHES